MQPAHLLHQLVSVSAGLRPNAPALRHNGHVVDYATLAAHIAAYSHGLSALRLERGERVAVYLDKRVETVTAYFGTSAAGGAFVPINPVFKAPQVAHILRDCGVRALVTSPERLAALARGQGLESCPELRHIILTDALTDDLALPANITLHPWHALVAASPARGAPRLIDTDIAAIFYTSGSSGRPKGVVLSHRNIVAGAQSVAAYLEHRPDDRLLAALPLSFDAGFSQLTTAFQAGACAVLLNYLLPRDVLKALEHERITGLTAVPPLWIQLAQQSVWPAAAGEHLRYFANTGGRLPRDVLQRLRAHLPEARPYLMYGLTEAFRATYLPPEEIDRRPDSIGKAIPNTEVLVLREDGTPCAAHEPGELVQRGVLVAQGYWNDVERTAERFKPVPPNIAGRSSGLVLPELAVFSGDTVQRDEDGFLYFIGRRDEMIKTSGYRVSPTEIEEVLYACAQVGECAAFGIPHPALGQRIAIAVTAAPGHEIDTTKLLAECRARMPAYMVPAHVDVHPAPLPRNPNGKIDRRKLAAAWSPA